MEKRPSLHKFQESLAARLREAAGEPVSTSRLGLQSGARNWMLKLEDAGEIVPVPDLTPVPLTKPWFLGLANVRGVLVSVVDLSRFVGGPATLRTPEARIVLAADRYQARAGILVDRMLGLRVIEHMKPVEAGAADASTRPSWSGADLQDGDGRHWTELEMQRLVSNDEFLQAGAS